ncbi:hypothetical protein D3C86_1954410 [compost metagenome]
MEQVTLAYTAVAGVMDQRGLAPTSATTGSVGITGFEMDNKAIRTVRFIAFELEAFPEQGEQISIHVGGSWLV